MRIDRSSYLLKRVTNTPFLTSYCIGLKKYWNMNQNEIWKPVVGFEGFYEISKNGLIRTVERIAIFGNRQRIVRSRIRKQSINHKGYLYVRLYNGIKRKNVLVHRALMEAFVPNPENKPFIDHINTIKTDNRLENLRWVTSSENTRNPLTLKHITDACATTECKEKQIATKLRIGSKNAPKKVFQYSLAGEFITEFKSLTDAIRSLGFTSRRETSRIRNIIVALDDNHKSAYGYMWSSAKKEMPKYIKPCGKRKAVKQIDEQGNTIKTWPSVSAAAKSIGVFDSNLSRRIKNHDGHYNGMIFKYIE